MGIINEEELETMTLPLDDETMNAIINEGEKVRLPDIPPGQTEANRKVKGRKRERKKEKSITHLVVLMTPCTLTVSS